MENYRLECTYTYTVYFTLKQPLALGRISTPERTPPSSPVEIVERPPLAQTPEPSPPSSPIEPAYPADAVSTRKPELVRRKSSETRLGVDPALRSSGARMPSTPFELSRELFVVAYVLFDAFDLGLLFAYILSVSTV